MIIFYLSHTQLYREYITSSEMYSLHLTHPKWTHTRSSGQPCYSARGAVGGSVPCSRTPQSWYWRRILPPPTIPAGPEIQTHNLPLTSPTRYPLGHDCPSKLHALISVLFFILWIFQLTAWFVHSVEQHSFKVKDCPRWLRMLLQILLHHRVTLKPLSHCTLVPENCLKIAGVPSVWMQTHPGINSGIDPGLGT